MNDSKKNLPSHGQTCTDSKQKWNASLPYPSWPFGTVPPAELKKWGRLHCAEIAKTTIDDAEEALL